MHKGYGRRTGPIWVVVAIMTVVMVIIARAGFKSFQSTEELYKANEVYYVNDKGSSVAIKVMGYRYRTACSKRAHLLFSET